MQTSKKFIFLIVLFMISLGLNLWLGSVIFSKQTWIHIWMDYTHLDLGVKHILVYRWHKAITTIFTGAALALSGLFMQSIFRNPIAGPYVLGTSSAAGLGVAILILGSSISGFIPLSGISIAMAAIIGSVLSLLGIILLYQKLKSAVSLLLAGLMLGIFSGAIINILSYFTQADSLQKFVFWSMGNLGNQSPQHIVLMTLISLIIFIISIFFIKDLNGLLIGENYAKSIGINVHRVNLSIISMSGILIGITTAFVGPIAFVGLAVPHIARLFFKTHLHQILIPGVLVIGSILMLLCDTIAQVPGSHLSLPINSITALFGAPLVLYLILKK